MKGSYTQTRAKPRASLQTCRSKTDSVSNPFPLLALRRRQSMQCFITPNQKLKRHRSILKYEVGSINKVFKRQPNSWPTLRQKVKRIILITVCKQILDWGEEMCFLVKIFV